ncbi:MAG: leucine--tRNA ligase [Candidatus Spechtbacterales bacterium]
MEQYNPQKIEKKWREKWIRDARWQVDIKGDKKPYYNLMMFPYPSAEGLHIGNLYAFVGSDIHGRYMRQKGYDVFEPIGFDAFGIHSENFALKKGIHPRELIKKSTDNFRRQLEYIGNIYSWDNIINTTDPEYYKWTQWIFLKFYEAGLAYKKEAPVQWCPSCKTVLANEQVISGRCERCDSVVESKNLNQWFLKITDYADRLLENLKNIDWSEHTKIAQRNWIGKSTGYRIKFPIFNSQFSIEIFTTRADTLFGATYIVLSPKHELISQLPITNKKEIETYINKSESKKQTKNNEKTGIELKGISAINPANKEEIPVWISDYVVAEYGTGAVMAVPAHDQRDFEFAKKYGLPSKQVICQNYPEKICPVLEKAYEGEGHLVGSEKFNGISSSEAREKIGKSVGGIPQVNYHLRDWLISRQRYWGPPIPIIYCDNCGTVPVAEKDLPVLLPYVENFQPTGTDKSPLAAVEEFVNVKCPKCAGRAKRETDVSDTFLDSSWYFLRYPSSGEKNIAWDKKITERWLPVDMYIGGQEHAVLHLMYARFITMFMRDQKLLNFEEPFKKFRAHGLLVKEGSKISKSKGNIVNPDELFEAFGADTLRTYLMFLSPLAEGGDWQDEGIRGVHRFLGRVWGLVQRQTTPYQDKSSTGQAGKQPASAEASAGRQETNSKQNLQKIKHQTIKKVTEDIERLHYNTAIAAMMAYVNALYENEHSPEDIETLLVLLAPFAPHITEELWERLGQKGSVHDAVWPEFDAKITKQEIITVPVQINGKLRAQIEVENNTEEGRLIKSALESERIKEILGDKKPKKTIAVKNKVVNLVI